MDNQRTKQGPTKALPTVAEIAFSLSCSPTQEDGRGEADARPHQFEGSDQIMKPIIISILLACALLQAQAGDIFTPNGQVLGYRSSNGWLFSNSGKEIGFFQGQFLYSPWGQELGYRSGRYIYSSRDGSLLGYCDGGD